MKRLPRLLIAAVSAPLGVTAFVLSPPPGTAVYAYVFGSLCIVLALACVLRGRRSQFFGSIVGTGLFAVCAVYLVYAILEFPFFGAKRHDSSQIGALMMMGVIGLPGALYVWTARFGLGRQTEQERNANYMPDAPIQK